MTPPSRSVLVTLTGSFFCFALVSSGQERKGNVTKILSGFPGYHLLTLKELDPDARAFLLQHFPKASPSVVHADFDGDGQQD
jgi:hypothetical protein